MPDHSFDTLRLHQYVGLWQAGDAMAADALMRVVGERLEHITRKMLRGYPVVHNHADTADVLQGSLLRLLNSLRRVQPESTRHFFNLAAVHVRRELLDLARRYNRAEFAQPSCGPERIHDLVGAGPAASLTEDDDLDVWCRFHEAVDQLPEPEREVMGLAFYDGWTQAQIGDLLKVDARTVRRRWQSACLRLQELVGEKLPRP